MYQHHVEINNNNNNNKKQQIFLIFYKNMPIKEKIRLKQRTHAEQTYSIHLITLGVPFNLLQSMKVI